MAAGRAARGDRTEAAVAVVSIWRGIWLLMDLYLFPSSPLLSSAVSIGAGILLLFAAGMSLDDAT